MFHLVKGAVPCLPCDQTTCRAARFVPAKKMNRPQNVGFGGLTYEFGTYFGRGYFQLAEAGMCVAFCCKLRLNLCQICTSSSYSSTGSCKLRLELCEICTNKLTRKQCSS